MLFPLGASKYLNVILSHVFCINKHSCLFFKAYIDIEMKGVIQLEID
jgi:hypothetical protein